MVYCSVPGCVKGNKNQNKRCMFTFPKKEELLQKWLEAIPNLKRPIKSSWRVCQYHFKPEDILDAFSHTIGGEVYLIERERPRLKPNVIPSKNLRSDQIITTRGSKTRSKKKHFRTEPSKKDNVINERVCEQLNSENEAVTFEDSGQIPLIRETFEITEIEQPTKEQSLSKCPLLRPTDISESREKTVLYNYEETSFDECNNGQNVREGVDIIRIPEKGVETNTSNKVNENSTHCADSPTSFEGESFDLFDSVFEVVLPTTLWGVHRSTLQKNVMFVCIDEEQLNINKMLTVDDNGDLKIYLTKRLIREEHWPREVLTPERISDMLAELDAMQICLGANLTENCEVLLTDIDNGEQRRQKLCKNCY
ncbi:uncharacterized protein LOC128857334 [Anastrepha ludens]|uniref:uncharacterized protein LOC128857334 n=1 Tax=Anastrepha ludens TaxID=28586 RepID=UPI0023B1ED9F|nr:uncharacterized protein LOC128857334 [Anastrepha ludens]